LNLPQSVFIKEIGPRINFQYGSRLSIDQKLKWINHLIDSGLNHIEVSTLMNFPNKQQFNEATELVLKLKKDHHITYGVLVPNKRSLMRAFVVDADEINFFISTSESYNNKIKNCSISQSLKDIKEMTKVTKDYEKLTRVYITTVFGCHDEKVNHQKAINLALQLLDDGVEELSFVDTVGKVTPFQVKYFLEDLLIKIPKERCSMQFYNTYGNGISNIYTSLSYGIQRFESANGGFGGCFPSNEQNRMIETEDLISFLHRLKITTDIDEVKLVNATNYISNQLNEEPTSKLFSRLPAKKHQT
jgi:hydroxymethylglutaryl-CoA lyase